MEPLASLNTLNPPISLLGLGDPGRATSEAQAPHSERPIELPANRVERNEPATPTGASRPLESGRESEPGLRIGAGESRSNPEERRPSIAETQLASSGASPRRAITYRIYPELSIAIQSQVIDREADEVLRSVPPDQRIELAQRFEEYIGQQLDVTG